ncbi:MAG: adenosylcobinamide-GDP ribazoletransferase [Deltaproteobacteria bacterium]|jgi:adenosylcobinamide-GDP ribazoletransferase|nr:adenosylcobinamide-GDP ribazoletransferase [Deltaproteobacteria bacterium]
MYRLFRQTLSFLTICPAPSGPPLTAEELSRSSGYFPLVGLVLGLIFALFWLILGSLGPPESVKAILVAIAAIVMTRGFHLDGLADTADALLSHRSTEEKLAIFKDCHLGVFGVTAIVLDLLLKVNLLEVALASPRGLTALILVPVWGRLAASLVAYLTNYVRPSGGLGQNIINGAGRPEALLALVSAFIISLWGGLLGLAVFGLTIIISLALAMVWRLALGGTTGDLLGASVELGEIGSLTLWVLLI